MRIIAGTYRSRILKSLKGHALRPTSDWLRETLFNILGPAVAGSHFLDLYAGTGAVGIEAAAAKLIRENIASLNIASGVQVIVEDASRALAKLAARPRQTFDFVFLDPPYAAEREYEETLGTLGASKLLSPAAIVIAEHRKSFELIESFGALQRYRTLKQGDAALSFFRPSPEAK